MIDEGKVRDEQTKTVVQSVSGLMIALTQQLGIPMPLVLSATHAEVIATLVEVAGSEAAAERCEGVASLLRGLHSNPEYQLETMVPHGRA